MNSTSILAYGATLVANAKDAVFAAIVSAAVSQIAVMNYWGEAPVDGRKPQTLTTVMDGQRAAFGIAKGKTQANDWLAVASLIRKRMEKDCADTLVLARLAANPAECFAMILQDVKGQIEGENTIEALRAWGNTGKAAPKSSVTKSTGEKILALCEKIDDVTDEEARAIVAKLQSLMNNRATVLRAAIDRKDTAIASAKAIAAKAKRDAVKLAKAA